MGDAYGPLSLHNFVYALPEVECIQRSKNLLHSTYIHTNGIFSLAQPRPLWLTKLASAAYLGACQTASEINVPAGPRIPAFANVKAERNTFD